MTLPKLLMILMAFAIGIAVLPRVRGSSSFRAFGDDLAFLRKHTQVILLESLNGRVQVALCTAYQGRVMTSTASGTTGPSLGWINRDHIAAGKIVPHINVYGGEDRFWMGPEGGQFSIFFKKGDPFDLEHWQTPPGIDSEPFAVVSQSHERAQFRKEMHLVNYSGTTFDLRVDREIRLLKLNDLQKDLGVTPLNTVSFAAFQSENKITNTGGSAWQKNTGLLSVWILGMFPPSPKATVVIPFREGPERSLGPAVNDTYFGKVPRERLAVLKDVLFFRADGQYRSKIGVSPRRAREILGSYDPDHRILTLVQFTLPAGAVDYVNSMWEIQKRPFGGDVVNSYNDGPPKAGAKPLGPFYELETSSPAADLSPGSSLTHTHRTFHFLGSEKELDPIARITLGVSLEQIKKALP